MNLSARLLAQAEQHSDVVVRDERAILLGRLEEALDEIKRLGPEETDAWRAMTATKDELLSGERQRSRRAPTRLSDMIETLMQRELHGRAGQPIGEQLRVDAEAISGVLSGQRDGDELARDLYTRERWDRLSERDRTWSARRKIARDVRNGYHRFNSSSRDSMAYEVSQLQRSAIGEEDLRRLITKLEQQANWLRRRTEKYEDVRAQILSLAEQEGINASPQELMLAQLVTEVEQLSESLAFWLERPAPDAPELERALATVAQARRLGTEDTQIDELAGEVTSRRRDLGAHMAMLLHAAGVRSHVEQLLEARIESDSPTAKTAGYYLSRVDETIKELGADVDDRARSLGDACDQLDAALSRARAEV